MLLKKLILFISLQLLMVTNVLAYDQDFQARQNENGKVVLTLQLPESEIIYANNVASSIGKPFEIRVKNASNLRSYNIVWPSQEHKFMPGLGKVDYFSGLVEIEFIPIAGDDDAPIHFTLILDFVRCGTMCVPTLQEIPIEVSVDESFLGRKCSTIFWIIILSSLGGFVLNFMPCVLPVLSLKIFAFLKNQDLNHKVANLFTIAGIFSCFWGFALVMIMIKSTGKQIGAGIGFQVPEFIIFLCLIITVFISLALGRIRFAIPSGFVSVVEKFGHKHIYLEHYVSGILATILSTPCTAPFLGTAASIAFTGDSYDLFLHFTFVALGFSTPYLLMILRPSLLNLIPKSPIFINSVKRILMMLMVGSLIWLLYILANQIGPRGAAGLFFLLVLIKHLVESNVVGAIRKVLKLFTILIIIYASFYLPMMASDQDHKINQEINDLWQPFDPKKIDSYVANGNVVFVDITADWCLSCKFNKFMVLGSYRLAKLFESHGVIALRGDFTSYSKIIDQYLIDNNSYGIPYYRIYGPKAPKGIELPVMISFGDIKKAIATVK